MLAETLQCMADSVADAEGILDDLDGMRDMDDALHAIEQAAEVCSLMADTMSKRQYKPTYAIKTLLKAGKELVAQASCVSEALRLEVDVF